MKLFLLRALLVLSLYAVPQLFAQSEKNSLPLISAPPFGEKLKISGLPNAGKISDSLYRGAQPHAEGFQELKKIGITAIVDLRKDNPQKLEWERKQAEAVGIRFVNIPVSGWSPPTNEQVSQFLSLFNSGREKERKKLRDLFVCWRRSHRRFRRELSRRTRWLVGRTCDQRDVFLRLQWPVPSFYEGLRPRFPGRIENRAG